ncbi:MAG: sugar phosphate nucleotidyltransferase [Mycobacterium leprae]
MKAVILAGGEGTRLRPLTADRPKPLVPVGNRPLLAYTLDLLAEQRFQEVFLTLGYRAAQVRGEFGHEYRGLRLQYMVEPSPMGTAGSVAALKGQLDETFLVIAGDLLTDADLGQLLGAHRAHRALATIGTVRVENPLAYGILLTGRDGRVRRFREKPRCDEIFSDQVNSGVYILEPAVLTGVPENRCYDFSLHLFPAMLQMEAPLYAAPLEGFWCDIGQPATYLQANLDLLDRRLRFRPAGEEVLPGLWVAGEPDLTDVQIDGPAAIGEGCRLAPFTRLEAGVVLGAGTVTDSGVLVHGSVTWAGVHLKADSRLVKTVVCKGE